MNTVIVIAAHPDDEVLGCGGTIAKHVHDGDEVHVLILAEGITSRDYTRDRKGRVKDITKLKEMANEAHKILGTSSIKLFDFPDNRMDSVDLLDVIKVIVNEFNENPPEIIYTHHSNDLNVDHRITHQAVFTACRPEPGTIVKKICCFEVPSSTEWQTPISGAPFIPNTFVDISSTIDNKLEALKAYESEMKPWPHSRSIKAVEYLARWRGASVGFKAAEAFIVCRNLVS
jgi:LmbE family N-acetylglucosaminyl deacetylase